ncbi:MAG: cytochrome c biogenesis protein [Anaerolineales bacterium]
MQALAPRAQVLRWMTYASLTLFILATLMTFLYPGPEQTMGEVQRIFYIHLGSFAGAFVLFLAALVGGIAYLRTQNAKWDHLSHASIEIGLVLSAITTVTGMFWAKPIWGAYWTWDPRLTTIAIMWLTYAAYLFLRAAFDDVQQRRRFAAVYAILAFGGVILTTVIIRLRPDVIHPVVMGPSASEDAAVGSFNVSGRIADTLFFNIFAYLIIAITLVWYRIRLEERSDQVQARKAEVLASL